MSCSRWDIKCKALRLAKKVGLKKTFTKAVKKIARRVLRRAVRSTKKKLGLKKKKRNK